jgi:hypothetical protein
VVLDLQVVLQNRWRRWAFGFSLWTLLTLVFALQEYFGCCLKDQPLPWSLILRRCAEEWYVWALLSFVVIRLSRWFPLEPGSLAGSLLIHVAGSLAISLAFCALVAALLHGQKSVAGPVFTFSDAYQKLVAVATVMNLIVYWAMGLCS